MNWQFNFSRLIHQCRWRGFLTNIWHPQKLLMDRVTEITEKMQNKKQQTTGLSYRTNSSKNNRKEINNGQNFNIQLTKCVLFAQPKKILHIFLALNFQNAYRNFRSSLSLIFNFIFFFWLIYLKYESVFFIWSKSQVKMTW